MTPQQPLAHLSRPGRRLTGAVLAVVTIAAVTVIGIGRANAAVPTITGPDRVFTLPNIPLPFTGVEILANNKPRTISISATNAGTCDPGGAPQVLTGCASIKLDVTHGVLKLTPSGAAVTVGDPVAGTGTLQLAGTVAQLNSALATLVFTPDNNYENTPSTSAKLVVNATDGTTGESTSSGSPDKSWTIDIRVATINQFPTITVPPGPIAVAAGADSVQTGNVFKADDPDATYLGEQGKLLMIAWVDCGTFDMSPSGNFAVGNDIKSVLINQVGFDASTADAIYALLPAEVKNLPLASSVSNVSAVAGVGTLTDINNTLSTVTFHAPNQPSTCTMTHLLDDLGNHGLPGQYQNLTHDPGKDPTGVELPFMGIDIDQVDFVVAGGVVPSVTVEQDAAQMDPTMTSPIHFTATFSTDVTGFDAADVMLAGTAGANAVIVTGGPMVYDLSVSGMAQDGTVIASIGGGAAMAVAAPNNANTASTSVDNVVTFQAMATTTTSTSTTSTSTSTTSTTMPGSTTTTAPGSTTTTTMPGSTTTTAPGSTTTTAPGSTTTTAPGSTTTTAPSTTTTAAPTTTTTDPGATTTTDPGATTTTDPGDPGATTTTTIDPDLGADANATSSTTLNGLGADNAVVSTTTYSSVTSLPVTGSTSGRPLAVGGLLVATGIGVLLVSRRRRTA